MLRVEFRGKKLKQPKHGMKCTPFSKPITNRSLAESCTTDTDEDDIATVTEFQHFVCVLTVDTARRSITKNT